MKLFNKTKKEKNTEQNIPAAKNEETDTKLSDEYLDDITYIQDMKQTQSGAWYQYDVLLAANGYGWEYMLSSADYLAEADLEGISEVQTGDMNMPKTDVTDAFAKNGNKCTTLPELSTERGVLSVAGLSKALRAPAKIVWINQTRVLRLFTIFDDEQLIRRYFETMVRRTFGTKDAMKLGKPLPTKTSQ